MAIYSQLTQRVKLFAAGYEQDKGLFGGQSAYWGKRSATTTEANSNARGRLGSGTICVGHCCCRLWSWYPTPLL